MNVTIQVKDQTDQCIDTVADGEGEIESSRVHHGIEVGDDASAAPFNFMRAESQPQPREKADKAEYRQLHYS